MHAVFWYNWNLYFYRISDYGLVSFKDSIFIIGGSCSNGGPGMPDKDSDLIAKYTIDQWRIVGGLLYARSGHRAILKQNEVIVVGGYYSEMSV